MTRRSLRSRTPSRRRVGGSAGPRGPHPTASVALFPLVSKADNEIGHVTGRRRHDIANLLAEPVAHDLCIPSSRLIEFVSYPENLRGLNHLQRYEAVSGCFGLARGAKVRDLRVVLVDDVLTHGATLHEIAKLLKSNGALAVSGLVVGVTRSHCPNCSRKVTTTKQDVEAPKSDRRRVSSGRRFRIKIGSEWQ